MDNDLGAGLPSDLVTAWRAGVFVLPRCTGCDTWLPLSAWSCGRCGCHHLQWQPAHGRGIIYAVTEVNRSSNHYFDGDMPHAISIIDLVEGVRMVASVRSGDDAMPVAIGASVKASLVTLGEHTVPVFVTVRQTPLARGEMSSAFRRDHPVGELDGYAASRVAGTDATPAPSSSRQCLPKR